MGTEEILSEGNEVKRKYVHKLSPEERSAIAKAAAAKRKTFSHGRPKGSKNKKHVGESITFTIRAIDHAVFSRIANAGGMTMMEFMHIVAEELRNRNPNLFESEVDNEQIRPESSAVADNQ